MAKTKEPQPPARTQRRRWGSCYEIGGLWYISYKGHDPDTGLARRFVNVPAMLPDGRRAQDRNEAEQVPRDRRHEYEHHQEARPASAERFNFDNAMKAVLDYYETNELGSKGMVELFIRKHLRPHFGSSRLMRTITALSIRDYQARRRQHVITVRKARTVDGIEMPAITKRTSPRQVNMEVAASSAG